MSWSFDARIPVQPVMPAELSAAIAAAPGAYALLVPSGWDLTPEPDVAAARFAPDEARHPGACACCAGRPRIGVALDQLFQARVRGTTQWFSRVLAVVPDEVSRQDLASALATDPLTAARFRAA
jgi:hypothetical protein